MISEDSKISLMQSESNENLTTAFPGASKKHPFQWPAAVRPRIITFFKLIDRCISFDLETVTKSLGLPGSQRWQAFWRPYLHPKMLGRCWLDGWFSDWLDVSVCSKHRLLEHVFMWVYVCKFKAEASNGGEPEWSWELHTCLYPFQSSSKKQQVCTVMRRLPDTSSIGTEQMR